MRNSEKHGVAGQSNAKSKPYRLVGGSHDRPMQTNPASAMAFKVPASKPHGFAHYQRAMVGGIVAARLGFSFSGSAHWEAELTALANNSDSREREAA